MAGKIDVDGVLLKYLDDLRAVEVAGHVLLMHPCPAGAEHQHFLCGACFDDVRSADGTVPESFTALVAAMELHHCTGPHTAQKGRAS